MSIVIAVATENYAIIGSDGRAICYTDNSIVTEEYNKTKRLNDHIILGCTGNASLCEKVVSYLDTLSIPTVEEAALHIKKFLESLQLLESDKCAFAVAGITASCHIELHSLGTQSHLQINRMIPASTFVYTILSPDNVNGDEIFTNTLYKVGCGNLKDIIRLSIKDAAKEDFSINTNCYFQEISL